MSVKLNNTLKIITGLISCIGLIFSSEIIANETVTKATIKTTKEISFSFDDSPRFATGYYDGPTRAKLLIEELKRHNIEQVAFFAVAGNMDEEEKKRLQQFNDAGHLIANHTLTHPNFNKTSLEDYRNNVQQNHELLKGYSNFIPWFRFPYLREGDTVEKRDGMRKYLKDNGYFNAYITLDNYDWYIESLFQRAVRDKKDIDFDKLKAFYVNTIIAAIEHYDNVAVDVLGRSPKHVLLLHEMDVTAMFVGDLADALREKGWKIISPEESYNDDIATFKLDVALPYNPGRVGEIAISKGKRKGLRHPSLDEKYLEKAFEEQVLN